MSFLGVLFRWACSSVGRAPALQAGGRRIVPGRVHQFNLLRGLHMIDAKRFPTLAAVLAEAADPSLKPPKKWAKKMLKEIKEKNKGYSEEQVQNTMGDIWYHKLDDSKRKEIREREGKAYGPAHPQAATDEDVESIYSADEMKGWVA
jgi:hypothetical protein